MYKVKKEFKYGGKVYKPGDIWEPAGGDWDKTLMDEVHGFVIKTVDKKLVCDYCGKEWDSVRSKAAHMRFCKEKPDGD